MYCTIYHIFKKLQPPRILNTFCRNPSKWLVVFNRPCALNKYTLSLVEQQAAESGKSDNGSAGRSVKSTNG